MKSLVRLGLMAFLAVLLSAQGASAIPILQLYVEGSTYDSATESWVLDGWAGEAIKVWAIGNVSGPGGKGAISNVKLSIAYDSIYATPAFALTATTASAAFSAFDDLTTPGAPTYSQTKTDGSTPLLTGGAPLPSHGEYGPGVHWQEYLLGDFTQSESSIGNFIDNLPTTLYADKGQINVYTLNLTSGYVPGMTLHMDLYDSVQSGTKAKFAPFSHDAGTGTTSVPEPSSLILLGAGILGLAGAIRVRK